MKYEDSVDEVIRIERFKNNKTYREIADKLQITIYRVKKVIYESNTYKNKREKRKGKD